MQYLEEKVEEAITLVIMSDQSDDNDSDSFKDFLAFLLSPPINSTNSVDSSSNIDDAASLDTASDIDLEAGNVPKRHRHSSVTFHSEIDDGTDGYCSVVSSGDNNDADSDGNDSLSHDELRDLLKPEPLSTENCNNDSRDQIVATTAVILIDFQNDIVKPDGKLHDDVSAIMEKNNVLSNIQQVVNTARYVCDVCVCVSYYVSYCLLCPHVSCANFS